MAILLTIVYILLIIALIVFSPYLVAQVKLLFQKELMVRSVTEYDPTKFGEAKLMGDTIVVKNFQQKTFWIRDIKTIEAYTETTAGLEEYCCIDFIFSNDKKICFDGSKEDQQLLINLILSEHLYVAPINWTEWAFPFLPQIHVIYERH